MDDRLPEMLWAALFLASDDRQHVLAQFRRVLKFIGDLDCKDQLRDLTLTGIASLQETFRSELIAYIIKAANDPGVLAPLLLLHGLPGREVWQRTLLTHGHAPSNPNEAEASRLMEAVHGVLWHQSEKATDCRWVRVTSMLMAGKLFIPSDIETRKILLEYPNFLSEEGAQACARALEVSFSGPEYCDPTWSRAFWQEAWTKTPCAELVFSQDNASYGNMVTRQDITELRDRLEAHWEHTRSTTATDARHDAVFGMAF